MKLSKKKEKSGKDSSVHDSRPTKKHNLKIHKVKANGKVKKPKPKVSKKALGEMSYNDYMNLESSESDSEKGQPSNTVKSKPTKKVKSRNKLKQEVNGSQSKSTSPNEHIKGSSFIDFEAEEDNELEHDSSFIVDDSDDDVSYDNLDVQGFLDREAKEQNKFDFGEDDHTDDDGDADPDVDDGDEDDDDGDVDEDGGDDDADIRSDDDQDKDYADVPGAESDEENEDIDDFTPTGHKKSLQKLRDTDPEFYKFLAENDKKLLQFQDSDSDDEDDSQKVHKPEGDLEIASDESDYELEGADDEGAAPKREGLITLKMVRTWQGELETDKSIETIANVMQAFHAALARVTGSEDTGKYKVDGSSVFNAVVQLCMLELQPAVKRFLRMTSGTPGKKAILPQKCKKWNKIKSLIKNYLQDLLLLMGGVSSPQVVSVLLKHLHQMSPFVAVFPNVVQRMLKRLTAIWGSGEETTRVIAFLCILRLCTNQASLLDTVLKQMYLTYVSNAKFVSPSTLPGINFMRRSLVEIYRLDESVSYQHVFLYVRQLAIHLRNAITLQKKETQQAVLNWQFVHSLHLWVELLGAGANQQALQPLLYPLVQVIIGTIKLVPTVQYFPLRFHCVQMLVNLSRNTNTFIPILPFLLEVLNTYNFNRSHKKASMKPMDMTCLLRVSKTEQSEVNFKDAVIEQIYQLMLQCLATEANSIAFPDLAVAPIMQIKKFLKECKIANYCRKIKSILDKMVENSAFVEKERKLVTLNIKDKKAVDAFETNLKLKGTPLATYYASFQKVNKQVLKKRATDSDKLGDFDLPTLKKHKTKPAADGPAVLFPSDSDSGDDNFGSSSSPEPEEKKKKKKKVKKAKKKSQSKPVTEANGEDADDEQDLVQDLKLEDL